MNGHNELKESQKSVQIVKVGTGIKMSKRIHSKETREKISLTRKQRIKDGRIKIWVKGLTKETDERLRIISIKTKRRYKENPILNFGFKKGNKVWMKRANGTGTSWSKGKKIHYTPKCVWKKGHTSHNKDKTKYNYEPLKKASEKHMGRKKSDKHKESLRKSALKPERIIQSIKNLPKYPKFHIKPNNPEKLLIKLFEHNKLPYKYVGDGKIVIGRKIPDFINVNGQKKVIELFGEWWHLKKPDIPYNRTEFGTKAIYSQYGFKTLVIWESELKDMDKVLERIKNFEVKT